MVQAPKQCSMTRCKGFVFVVTLIAVHLATVAIITVFTKHTRYSQHENVWHTISQLMTIDFAEILGKANNSTDDILNHNENSFVRIGVDESRFIGLTSCEATKWGHAGVTRKLEGFFGSRKTRVAVPCNF